MRAVIALSLRIAVAVASVAAVAVPSARAFDIVAAQYGSSTAGFPYAVSMAKGFFKESGADVTGILASIGGGNDVRNLVAANLPYAEVALPSAIAAMQHGADLVIVSENVQNAASAAWATMPNSPINSIKDLKGMRMGYSSPQSFTQAIEALLLDKAGYRPGDVTLVSTGGFGPGLVLLEHGGVDVTVIALTDLLANPTKYKVVMRGRDVLPPINNTVGIVSRSTLPKNAKLVTAIIEGRRKGVEYMTSHRDESAEIIGKAYKLDADSVKKIMVMLIDNGSIDGIPYWGVGNINYAGLNNMLEAGRKIGMISGDIDLKKEIDESMLPADLKSKSQ